MEIDCGHLSLFLSRNVVQRQQLFRIFVDFPAILWLSRQIGLFEIRPSTGDSLVSTGHLPGTAHLNLLDFAPDPAKSADSRQFQQFLQIPEQQPQIEFPQQHHHHIAEWIDPHRIPLPDSPTRRGVSCPAPIANHPSPPPKTIQIPIPASYRGLTDRRGRHYVLWRVDCGYLSCYP